MRPPLAHRLRNKLAGSLLPLVAGFVLLLLQLPVIIVVLASVTETSYLTVPPKGFTLDWYARVLGDASYIKAILFSFTLAVATTILALVCGTAAAYALVRRKVPGGEAISALLTAPLVWAAGACQVKSA